MYGVIINSQAISLLLLTLCQLITAFPQLTSDQLDVYLQHSKKDAKDCPYAPIVKPYDNTGRSKRETVFNAQQQRIDVTGDHAFIPPNFAAGDQRGPCPGLNALANHGYIPRNGVSDLLTLTTACNKVYGMGLDLGGILSVVGTVFTGNPISLSPGFSIGGPSQSSQNILGGLGLLGTPGGLIGSHNKYEGDASGTRGDLYLTGNNFHVQRNQFIDYYYSIPEDTPSARQYTALGQLHYQRFLHSKNNNPYFFYAPFAGILVTPASYSFPPRMMANHSEQYPNGYLSRQNFADFFGVQGNDRSNFVVKQGWERIPDNWYRRPIGDDFSLVAFLLDVVEHSLEYPALLAVGGNTGTPDSFALVDVGNLTGGVYNSVNLLDPAKLECFVLQLLMTQIPDFVGSFFANVSAAAAPLLDRIVQTLAGAVCPQLQEVHTELFNKYPGYTKAYKRLCWLEIKWWSSWKSTEWTSWRRQTLKIILVLYAMIFYVGKFVV